MGTLNACRRLKFAGLEPPMERPLCALSEHWRGSATVARTGSGGTGAKPAVFSLKASKQPLHWCQSRQKDLNEPNKRGR